MKSSSKKLELRVNDEHTYIVVVGKDVLKVMSKELEKRRFTPKLAVIGKGVYENFPNLREELSRIFQTVDVLDDGERSKDIETALGVVERLWELGATRWDAIACVSGGSLCDTIGFAASIYMRGLPFVQVPTTLLAMIDSSLGGKTAVNYRGVKNILGSFYHPSLVISDITFIETLPERVYLSSLAEAIKYGVTLSKDYFEFLYTKKNEVLSRSESELIDLISAASKLKLEIVGRDPRERRGVREVLNYGHTVGHAIESGSKYALLHGEAVAIGMIVETEYIDKRRNTNLSNYVSEIIEEYNILRYVDFESVCNITEDEYKSYIFRDKKRIGENIKLPIILEIGKWMLIEIPVSEFAEETFAILKHKFCN